jgi:hypothetical protein
MENLSPTFEQRAFTWAFTEIEKAAHAPLPCSAIERKQRSCGFKPLQRPIAQGCMRLPERQG